MKYPTDWKEEYRRKPICGVLSVAMIAEVTFARATEAIKNNLMPFQKRHGGKTYAEQRKNALLELGFKSRELPVTKMTLEKWVGKCSELGKIYMVTTSSHVVTVIDGMVADQVEIKDFMQHGSRRCYIRHVLEII